MGKKLKKPGKGKEKTERKTVKAAEKKFRREEKKLDEEDDIDAILAKIQKEEAKKVAVHVDQGVPAPSPRCNCSMTLNPAKETELIFYGGEYYNGDKTFVYGDLYRYSTDKEEWCHVSSPNSPPPRSAHQAVAWKNFLFVFGGEFTSPNQERFHHYKDLWRLDLTTNVWEQLQLKGGPSPRSGHRMVLYKHKLLLFGGFYDTLREVRYYNDLYALDLDEYKWQEIKPKTAAAWPSPRSAFQLAVHQEEIFLYGGYFKDHAKDKDGSDRGVIHADMWTLDPRSWEWNKVKRLGQPPIARAGFSLCVHKKRAILYGGVVDQEVEKGDALKSTFLNDMYVFQMDNRRWYPFTLRRPKDAKNKGSKAKKKAGKSKHSEEEQQEAGSETDEDDEESGRKRRSRQRGQQRRQQQDAAEEEDEEEEWQNQEDWEGYSEGEDDEAEEEQDGEGEEDAGGNAITELGQEVEGRGEQPGEGGAAAASADALAHTAAEADESKQPAAAESEDSPGGVEAAVGAEKVGRASVGAGQGDESLADDVKETMEKLKATLLRETELQRAKQESAASKKGAKGAAEKEPESDAGPSSSAYPEEEGGPCGRINAAVAVGGNTLYLYGGIMEIGDREVTLDDLYTLDLNKLDTWKCVAEASHSEWVEVEDDEEEDEDEEGDDDEGGDDSGNEEDEQPDEAKAPEKTAAEAAAAVLRGDTKLNRKDRKVEIDKIRAELGLGDSERTPLPGETLREFFARTSIVWQIAAYERTQHTGKELRRDGFDLCEGRYLELRPVLDELERLEKEQQEEEAEAARQKAKDKGKRPAARR
eukprot:jgi/Mesen1/8240/ME000443S07392